MEQPIIDKKLDVHADMPLWQLLSRIINDCLADGVRATEFDCHGEINGEPTIVHFEITIRPAVVN